MKRKQAFVAVQADIRGNRRENRYRRTYIMERKSKRIAVICPVAVADQANRNRKNLDELEELVKTEGVCSNLIR